MTEVDFEQLDTYPRYKLMASLIIPRPIALVTTLGAGRFLGADNPSHCEPVSDGNPASANVGMFGNAGSRAGVEIASARKAPAFN